MYLVVNLGLKSIRGIVFNEAGKQVFSSSRAVYSKLIIGKVEQDAHEWKKQLESILDEITAIDSLISEIQYITSTTSSSCIYGMSEDGSPLTKVMMVSDKRAASEADYIQNLINSGFENTTLNCPASSILPKALWFKKNKPQVFDSVKYWMGAGEFLNHYFTGEVFTDSLNANKGLHENGKYPEDVLKEVGLDVKTLPEVKEIGLQLSLTKEVTQKHKFNSNCKYVLTTYDAICAVIGSYDGEKNTACDVSGTVTSVRVLSDTKLDKPKGTVLSQELGGFNKHLIGASNNLGGGIVEWLKQAFYDENNKDVYSMMENNAQEVPIGAHGIIFLPYMLGERSPFKSPNARGVFFGIERSSTNKELTRAVLESTAYVSNDLMQLIISNDVEVNSMSVSGGLARFDLVNQIKADVTNKRVKVIENFESTAVGSLILLLVSLNKYSSIEEAASKIIKVRKIINPSEENHKIYAEFFDFYKKINSQLMPLYDEHLKIRKLVQSYSSETISNL